MSAVVAFNCIWSQKVGEEIDDKERGRKGGGDGRRGERWGREGGGLTMQGSLSFILRMCVVCLATLYLCLSFLGRISSQH